MYNLEFKYDYQRKKQSTNVDRKKYRRFQFLNLFTGELQSQEGNVSVQERGGTCIFLADNNVALCRRHGQPHEP